MACGVLSNRQPAGVLRTAEALVKSGGCDRSGIAFDRLLATIGRQARLNGFGLEELGIPPGRTIEN